MTAEDGIKIVVIGGGTGLSSTLRGLKYISNHITAIVTVADDGGSSGMLRNDYGVLPPGDIRNCIMALADTEPMMEKLMQYRFVDGPLKGQNFGNILLMAMSNVSGGFMNGIREISNVLAVTGTVLPVTLADIKLCAQLENGAIIEGESAIPLEQVKNNSPISRIFIKPEKVEAIPEALEAIAEAELIILGPGSLYTSIIPNLTIGCIAKALTKVTVPIVYAANIMTQTGETLSYKLSDHIDAIDKHIGQSVISYIICNTGEIDPEVEAKYNLIGEMKVEIDGENISEKIKLICCDLVKEKNGFIRHNAETFAEVIENLPITRIWQKHKK